MRISDWSSDVCSSDLLRRVGVDARQLLDRKQRLAGPLVIVRVERVALDRAQPRPQVGTGRELPDVSDRLGQRLLHQVVGFRLAARQRACERPKSSEEHTSELQSLMRISYAVFCLKKKNN